MTTLGNNIVQKWIEALRSGEYAKGRDRLIQYDTEIGQHRYCCLGVLCEVMGIAKDDTEGQECYYDTENGNAEMRMRYSIYLPDHFAREVGITSTGLFKVPIEPHIDSLTKLNDNTNKTFSEIADIIEENFKKDNFIKY